MNRYIYEISKDKEEREVKNERILNLFDTYADDLYRFAVSYTGSKQEAEDIVQDLFLKIISKNIILGKNYEKAYLMKMTANLCKDYLKAGRVTQTASYDALEDYLGADVTVTGEDRLVYDSLMELEEAFREPIYLHYYEGYTYREIAGILQISESAVAMRISRGKEALRKRMEV
ncbi:sigma-70 region 2 [Clostridium sp. CAG:632]|nr:RNA polymerase sigma factor [Clostridium sp.]MDD6266686.1 RNA polymerase sigma factor [Clostridium sp.]CCY58208.1 sigma-70 region 2 [Clostridium sp. CAG:632]